jgi:hypothetical protein
MKTTQKARVKRVLTLVVYDEFNSAEEQHINQLLKAGRLGLLGTGVDVEWSWHTESVED